MTQSQEWHDGYAAYCIGKHWTDNPHDTTVELVAWDNGWLQAQKGDEEAVSPAFQAGYDAYQAGDISLDNPYTVTDDKWAEWDAGWAQAESEDEPSIFEDAHDQFLRDQERHCSR